MRGLPQKGAYETILRDALASDSLDPLGLYFGTRSGVLYGSTDEGKNWKRILEGVPSIVCVKTAIFGEPHAARQRRPKVAATRSARKTKPPKLSKRR